MSQDTSYNDEAKLERTYSNIAKKQREIVDTIAEMGRDTTNVDIAEAADTHNSYVGKVRKWYPHIIDERIEGQPLEDQKSGEATKYHYGQEAELDRGYETLTPKQQSVVDTFISKGRTASDTEVAEQANVSPSYVNYVRVHFPHIITSRDGTMKHQVAADGGATQYSFEMQSDDVLRMIKLLPDELADKIFNQVRK